jgi:IMP dehydrogenase/GMP reductase
MDTVTEGRLALAMAKAVKASLFTNTKKVGGMGILHRNLDPESQAFMVKWVRRKIHYGGMVSLSFLIFK